MPNIITAKFGMSNWIFSAKETKLIDTISKLSCVMSVSIEEQVKPIQQILTIELVDDYTKPNDLFELGILVGMLTT